MQAEGGLLEVMGTESSPALVGVTICCDIATGMAAYGAILRALLDSIALQIELPDEGPATTQERAYTPPIWYAP